MRKKSIKREQMVDRYICLTGEAVQIHENEVRITYDKKLLAPYFTCPISQNWFHDPVVVNHHVYDSESIKTWIATSNLDPITGETWPNEITLYKFNLLKYLMYIFEEINDTLVMHSCPNTIRYVQMIAPYLPIKAYIEPKKPFIAKKYNFELQNLSVTALMDKYNIPMYFENQDIKLCNYSNNKFSHCKLTNCLYDPSDLIDCEVVNNIKCYTLEEYLFLNTFTGLSFIENERLFLTKKGFIIPQSICNSKVSGYTFDSLEYYIHHVASHDYTDITKIMQGFHDILHISISAIIPTFEHYPLYALVRKLTPIESTLPVSSIEETVYHRVCLLKDHINEHLEQAMDKLANMVTNETLNKNCDSDEWCPVMKARDNMGIPYVVDQMSNMYGKDLSLLKLNNKLFHNVKMKDFIFSGCSFTNTRFVNCSFMECCFVGADLSDCRFENCKFTYCRKFYKIKKNHRTKFINCDSWSPELFTEFE